MRICFLNYLKNPTKDIKKKTLQNLAVAKGFNSVKMCVDALILYVKDRQKKREIREPS